MWGWHGTGGVWMAMVMLTAWVILVTAESQGLWSLCPGAQGPTDSHAREQMLDQ